MLAWGLQLVSPSTVPYFSLSLYSCPTPISIPNSHHCSFCPYRPTHIPQTGSSDINHHVHHNALRSVNPLSDPTASPLTIPVLALTALLSFPPTTTTSNDPCIYNWCPYTLWVSGATGSLISDQEGPNFNPPSPSTTKAPCARTGVSLKAVQASP